MNAYAKYVLIPQQEYARLKKPSRTSVFLSSNRPKLLKKSDISRNLNFNDPPPPPIFGKQSDDEDIPMKDIEESNLPEAIKSKLTGELRDDFSDEFMPSKHSTPHGSFSGELDLGATASGKVIDKRSEPVAKSNVKTVKNFLMSSKSKKQPAGTQAALDALRDRPELARRIRNPIARKKLNLDQVGSGWISIRSF